MALCYLPDIYCPVCEENCYPLPPFTVSPCAVFSLSDVNTTFPATRYTSLPNHLVSYSAVTFTLYSLSLARSNLLLCFPLSHLLLAISTGPSVSTMEHTFQDLQCHNYGFLFLALLARWTPACEGCKSSAGEQVWHAVSDAIGQRPVPKYTLSKPAVGLSQQFTNKNRSSELLPWGRHVEAVPPSTHTYTHTHENVFIVLMVFNYCFSCFHWTKK